MSEKFCLKWNDFQTNVTNSFKQLRNSDDFYDVTLVSDDKQQVSAHKIVLASSSEYFKDVLKNNKHSHPLLCLNGVNSQELNFVLDYMYNGEVQIYQENLDGFLELKCLVYIFSNVILWLRLGDLPFNRRCSSGKSPLRSKTH